MQIAGYSTFLRSEWLASFTVNQKSFQAFVTGAKLVPGSSTEFSRQLEHSAHQGTRLLGAVPALGNAVCYQRVFKESEEHQRGGVYAVFDPATSTAAVFREYHD